jgi:hypothetical protein
MDGGSSLPLGILLLGVAGIAGFMAFRPWPSPGGNPIKPGAYAIEILKGQPPAASTPPDRQADIAVIEGGLATILGVWALSKLAGAVSGLPSLFGGKGGSSGEGEEGESIGEEIEQGVGEIAEDL